MKIAIYTLTRDRLLYTKQTFVSLWEHAGYPFDHFIVDNGSTDGTPEWLTENAGRFRALLLQPENRGISSGSNIALNTIRDMGAYDLVVKMDNDILVLTADLLARIVSLCTFCDMSRWLLSPAWTADSATYPPVRVDYHEFGAYRIGRTGQAEGGFQIAHVSTTAEYRYPMTLPLARGQDSDFSEWFRRQGGECGYIENLLLHHIGWVNGDMRSRWPEYYER